MQGEIALAGLVGSPFVSSGLLKSRETTMVEKCANPTCAATFRRLRDGSVFVMEFEEDYRSAASGRVRQRQYVWLCNSCCQTMTVFAEKGRTVQVVPLPASATAVRAEFSFRTELTVEPGNAKAGRSKSCHGNNYAHDQQREERCEIHS